MTTTTNETDFRAWLFAQVLARTSTGRLARVLLADGTTDWCMNRRTVLALRRAGRELYLPLLRTLWSAHTGQDIDPEQWQPAPEAKKPGSPTWKYREEGAKFIGVHPTAKKRFSASIYIAGKETWIGTFDTEAECASAWDSAARARGKSCTLNFRSAADQAPAAFTIARAA